METKQMVSMETLEETAEKAMRFLRVMGTRPEAQDLMAAAGYSSAENALGWSLLHEVLAQAKGERVARTDARVVEAMRALDAWDEGALRRAEAALVRLHPAQAAFVMQGLEPGQGVGAVVAAATFLSRLDALASAPERAATRDADHAALATLAARGFDEAERARLAGLVAVAQSARLEGSSVELDARTVARRAALEKLHAWYADWSTTARAVIKSRELRIQLGFARRRVRADETSAPSAPTA